jgi:hypothetical protein
MFLILFLISRGMIPVDLPYENPFKRILYENDLIEMARQVDGDIYFKSVVLSIFFQEQGKSDRIVFWNNNSSGIHPWAKRYPWGWGRRYWVCMPSGYTILKEGQTGIKCPYFSFHYLRDCFLVTYAIVYDRGIKDYRTYCLRWSGGSYDYKSGYLFNENIRKFYYLFQ